jgi:hypothetical protein
MKEKRFRVEIVDLNTNKVVSVIGKGLSERKAERRELTGLSRINPDKFFIQTVEEK